MYTPYVGFRDHIFTCAKPIQFEVDSNHLAKRIGSMRFQSGLVQCTQCGRNQYESNAHSMSSVDRP